MLKRSLSVAFLVLLAVSAAIQFVQPVYASPGQFARPDSDITAASWTTAPLWSKIDEVTFDDADVISSTGAGEAANELGTSDVTDPVSSSGHILRFRMRSAGSGGAETVNMQLFEGASLRAATGTKSNRAGTFLGFTYTLTAAEADSITDYTNLRFKFVPTHGDSETVFVSWAEFEVPDVSVTVTQPIQITVDNSGTSGTATISGCAVSPTTNAMDGVQRNFVADPSCTLTVTMPTDAANTRYRVTASTTTYTIVTCGSGTCAADSKTVFYQLQNTYQATPNAQATWDSGLTAPNAVGTVAGAGSTTICSITLTGGGGAASCSGWGDYNRQVTVGLSTIAGAPANSQWLRSGAGTFTQTTGGNTNNVDWYKQWTNTFQVTASAQATFDTGLSAIVTGNSLGVSGTICTISPTGGAATGSCSGYVDHGNTPTIPTTMSGAPANSQWKCGTCNFGSVTSGGATLNINEYKQWTNTFQLTANAQATFDSGLSLAATGTNLGAGSSTICTISPTGGAATGSCSGYSDHNTAVTGLATMSGAPANSRWIDSTGAGFTFATPTTGGSTFNRNFYKQWTNTWQATPNAQATWDSGLTAQNVVGTNLGTASSTICTITLTGGGGAASCSGYTDHSTATVIGASTIGGAPANSQWLRNGACSFTETTGGNTRNCDWYKQWTETWQITANAQATFDSGVTTTVKGKVLAVASTTICSITVSGTPATANCSGYIDHNEAATYDTTMGSAPANSQWKCGTCATSAQTTGGNTVNINYYKQWTNTYRATPLSPTTWNGVYTATVSGTSLGVASTTICTITTTDGGGAATCSGYADHNLAVSLPATLTGASTWDGVAPLSFTDTTGGNTRNVDYNKAVAECCSLTNSSGLTVTYTSGGVTTTSTAASITADIDTAVVVAPSGGYSCTYTIKNASFVYQFTPSGLQIWASASTSSLFDNTVGPEPLWVRFTVTGHVILCNPSNSRLITDRFFANGIPTTFTGSTPFFYLQGVLVNEVGFLSTTMGGPVIVDPPETTGPPFIGDPGPFFFVIVGFVVFLIFLAGMSATKKGQAKGA